MRTRNRLSADYDLPAIVMIAAVVGCITAWITHLVWVIATLASDGGATMGQIGLGAIGAFMPPVGVVHGVMIWFGMGLG